MLDPKAEELVLDPACGSGGFLLAALHHVRETASGYFEDDPVQFDRYWREFAAKRLYGIEINEELTRVAKMNMILHEDGHTNIVWADALERAERLRRLHRGLTREHFDLVITNPPFGAQVTAADRNYLADFELGRQPDGKPRRAQKTEILFVERVWEFLKPGGRAGIVLPDGILSNTSLQYVRDFILDRFQVLAVVSLPSTAFFHFGATVKSSLVFLRKREPGEAVEAQEFVFMAAPELIGYDATGRETKNELPNVLDAYREFLVRPADFI
jgi:type I restriction enzyme M protein